MYVGTCVPEPCKQIRRAPRFPRGTSCREMQEGIQSGDAQCLILSGHRLQPRGAGLVRRAQLTLSKHTFL